MKKKSILGMMPVLLLASILTLMFDIRLVNASGAIYIRPDGSIDPPTAPIQTDGNLYVLTSDVIGSIIVQKDGIVIHGNGHVLQSDGESLIGVDLAYRQGVTVTKLVIKGFCYGVWFDKCYHNTLLNNTFIENMNGVWFSRFGHPSAHFEPDSGFNEISGNVFRNNTDYAIFIIYSESNVLVDNQIKGSEYGIIIFHSSENVLRQNSMESNKYSFLADGVFLDHLINDVDVTNTVNNKPIYYWINRCGQTVPSDAGCVVIVNSSRITVKNLEFRNNLCGLMLAYTQNSLIESVTATENSLGICLEHSDYNTITRSNATTNSAAGIAVGYSHHNTVSHNFVKDTNGSGIWLEDTYYNKVIGNYVAESRACFSAQEFDGAGILVDDSRYTEVTGNNVTENWWGIVVGATPATSNLIIENNIEKNNVGFILADTKGNTIYHNNLIENKEQVRTYWRTTCTFDAGYPSGGNYWSDYAGWDANNDGIGDQPYVINEDNQDPYPLMSPYGSPPLPMFTLTIEAADHGTTNPAPGSYRHSKGQTISVNAFPNAGYLLDHWELDSVNIGAPNPVNIPISSNHTLRAVFAVPTYNVTVKAYCITEGVDAGLNITMDGSPTGCITPYTFTGLTDTHTFMVPNYDAKDHAFKHWSTGQTSTNITVSSGGTYVAYYDMKCALKITSSEGGVTDPEAGTHALWWGTTVSVTAIPNAGYYLDYWQLDGINIGAPNPELIRIDMNHTLHAIFTQLSSEHDVAIKYVTSKTIVGQGCSAETEVTATNVGGYHETFNVTVYVNATCIASQMITLESGASTTCIFTWNTTGFAKGNYTLSSVACPVPGEVDTTNNNFTDGWAIVAMIGDITGPEGYPDGKCDIRDVSLIASKFGSIHQDPKYDLNCDLTGPTYGVADGKIDIRDVALVTKHFGDTL